MFAFKNLVEAAKDKSIEGSEQIPDSELVNFGACLRLTTREKRRKKAGQRS